MEEKDAEKTAISMPYGLYECKRMSFGLSNTPWTFQLLMDRVWSGSQGTELSVYLEDIVMYARSLKEHWYKLIKLVERLRKANLKLQQSKCGFLHREFACLGYVISDDGVKHCPQKIAAVQQFPSLKNVKNVREFLGFAR